MPTEIYALLLLIFRLLSVGLLINVLYKQTILRKRPVHDTRAEILRRDMYTLTWVAFLMNIVPIIVDVSSIMGHGTRPSVIEWLSVGYVFSYSFGTLALTAIIYRM